MKEKNVTSPSSVYMLLLHRFIPSFFISFLIFLNNGKRDYTIFQSFHYLLWHFSSNEIMCNHDVRLGKQEATSVLQP